MSTCSFQELLLSSVKERRARKVSFHPSVTVIRGENETGKSSLLKSIFYTFGAVSMKTHPAWKGAEVRSLLRFTVGDRTLAILRYGGQFAVFDHKDRVLKRFAKVTSELAPFLASLFRFRLQLPDREGVTIALPPAYYFLPSYMDQDGSWGDQWTGFADLAQLPNWKKGVIEYHAGIRGNEYYEAQAAKLAAEGDAREVARRFEALSGVYTSLGTRFEASLFNVDFAKYKQEIAELLAECDVLREREHSYKRSITELRNERQSLKTQLDLARHAREEARKDYAHAQDADETIACPTCGATYHNSFAERFAIAVDEDQCSTLIVQLEEEMVKVDARLEREMANAVQAAEGIARIQTLLERKEGEVQLEDLIRQEGRQELRRVMHDDLAALDSSRAEFAAAANEAKKRMGKFGGKDQRERVNELFAERMRSFLQELDVSLISDKAIQKVDAKLPGTGSELPRALLAYKLAFLHVADKFATAVSAPLVIDSPNQQDQDIGHLESVLRFIRDRRPVDRQLILGVVDLAGVEFEGTEIVLDRKRQLLSADEYDEVGAEVQRYVDIALEGPAPSTPA